MPGERESNRLQKDAEGVIRAHIDPEWQEDWRELLADLPGDTPLKGLVHLMGVDGHGTSATTPEMAKDVGRAMASALALV